MKPLIGISAGTFHDRAWCPPSYGHRQTYVDAVVRAGGAPMLLPPIEDEAALYALYQRVDGLLLAGGGDIAPEEYGDTRHEKLGVVDALRDQAELPMARWAYADGKPVLGICRGVQVLNVALGGTLYQDIPSQIPTPLHHNLSYEYEDWTYMAHAIAIDPQSKLADLLSTEELTTNSLHHQSLRDIAPGLRAVAWAPDGVVEAVESVNDTFLLGIQCHPEALQGDADPRWRAVFAHFVERCREYHLGSYRMAA
jgi:putative glutamine amidotransferase